MKLDKSLCGKLQPKWIKGLHKSKSNILLLVWFQAYYLMKDIKYVYTQNQINVEINLYKKWNLVFGSTIPIIHKKLKESTNLNEVNFNEIIDGQLFGFIKRKDFPFVLNLRFNPSMDQKNPNSKKEVGTFCEAFRLQKIQAPFL